MTGVVYLDFLPNIHSHPWLLLYMEFKLMATRVMDGAEEVMS